MFADRRQKEIMANKFANAQNERQESDESLDGLREDKEFSDEVNYAISGSKSKRLIRWANPQQALVLSVKHSHIGKKGSKDPLFKSAHGLEYRIPKRMVVSLDEKYLRRCLELIHFRASKAVRCNVSEKIGGLPESLSLSEARSGDAFDSTRLVFECPVVDGAGSVVVGPSGQWILGTIMGSKSMTNILKSPLFQKYGALDSNVSLTGINYTDANGSIRYELMDSPSPLNMSSPFRPDKGTPSRERHRYGNDTPVNKRMSMSSTNSVCSDQTSSSASTGINQGMLQCTWKGGYPHFVLTTDDHKDVYVANLWKVESRDEKALDYIYLFHSGKSGQKDHEISDGQSHIVGKMKVSNSFTLGANNAKVLETEFVLFGGIGGYITEMPTSSHNLRKGRGLSKKMAEVFRTGSSAKPKTISKFSGPCAIQENSSLDLDTGENSNATGGPTFLDEHPPPNFELAAIVVKDRIPNTQKEEAGGWGLKFLKKVRVKQTIKSTESSSLSFECYRNNGDCSTSMDILIPAGLHGGLRTRNGGPSSLTERWRSGGHCDCGGWDVGCPLTLLKPRSNKDEEPLEQEEFRSFDLVTQGSQHGAPTLRIVSVQDNLYFIHFQRTLSVLQSFSIAVATIHTRSPALRPKDVHELK